MNKKIAAAAVLTGGTAISIPTISGLASVFMDDTGAEAIGFIQYMTHTIFSLFA